MWKSSILVTTSPARKPAFSAAPPLTTCCSDTPVAVDSSESEPATVTPSAALVDLPLVISSFATRAATSEGMAKPMPMLPGWPPSAPELVLAIEELMPTTAPSRSTSGPQSCPG